LSNKLNFYKENFDSKTIKEEFVFYLKEKLHFSDKDIFIDSDRVLTKGEKSLIEEFFEQKKEGIPLDYILNSTKFYESDFFVDSRVLIPRSETEILVDYVNNHFNDPIKVLDAGTGSGCIGISIALKKTNFKVYGSDFSKNALDVASINKTNLNAQNFFLINADWLSCFKNDSFDLILSNPPYISQNDLHLKDLTHEPKIALASNESGYSDIKKITQQSSKILKRRGILMIEHGYNQEKVVKSIFKDNYFSDICTIEDYQAHPRVTYGILNK
tara:strand:+ start:184 stop:999 length:816 start_codon:yes stop_codon:yes gene_type:complete